MAQPTGTSNVLATLDGRHPTAFYWRLTLLATLGGFLFGYDTANIGSALNFVPYGLPGLAQGYVVACCARQDSLRLLMRPCGTCPTRLTSIMPRSPADINHTAAAAVPISGLTAWQGLFDHAQLKTSQTLLVHGAAGGVGSIAVQLAHELGAAWKVYVKHGIITWETKQTDYPSTGPDSPEYEPNIIARLTSPAPPSATMTSSR